MAHIASLPIHMVVPMNHRHDRVVEYVADSLRRRGYHVIVEPCIPTLAGIRKPDLIVYDDTGGCSVIDATVDSDDGNLDFDFDLKCQYSHRSCCKRHREQGKY